MRAASSVEGGGFEDRIRERAYYLWEASGRPEGRDLEFWEQARRSMSQNNGAMPKTYLLMGMTGVGKSSFVNATFAKRLADTDAYRACTTLPIIYGEDTAHGPLQLIDTPGLAENTHEKDLAYLDLVKAKLIEIGAFHTIYISSLTQHRLSPSEMRSLSTITKHLGNRIWRSATLVLTFAASVPPARLEETVNERHTSISKYLVRLHSERRRGRRFTGFEQIIYIDNVTPNWHPEAASIASMLGEADVTTHKL